MSESRAVVTAIVSDLNDPAGEGRIRVRFRWLQDEPQSAWAPMVGRVWSRVRNERSRSGERWSPW